MPKKGRRNSSLGIKRKYYRDKEKSRKSLATDEIDNLNISVTDNNNVLDSTAALANVTYTEVDEEDGIEETEPFVDDSGEKRLKYKIQSTALRYAIMVLFVNKYKALDNVEDGKDMQKNWQGKNGLVSKIKADLGIAVSQKLQLVPVFLEIIECARSGKAFDASDIETRGGCKPVLIKINSMQAQVLADCIESGLSIMKSRQILNDHMLENGENAYSRSAIDSLLLRMKPRIEKNSKRKQGSRDPSHPWSRARYLWSKQLLIRFGQLPSEDEPRFKQSVVGKLDPDQIVWWDETHRKCLIGGLNGNKNYTMKFKRDANGKLDHENGSYSDKKIQILNCKYEKECRLGLGCALITPKSTDGSYLPSKGVRIKPFNYSEKVLLSVTDYEKKMAAEFRRVKSLTAKNGYWIEGTREPDRFYLDDKLSQLKKVGKVTAKKLADAGFNTVHDLKSCTDIDSINVPGVSKPALKKYGTRHKLSSTKMPHSPKTIALLTTHTSASLVQIGKPI